MSGTHHIKKNDTGGVLSHMQVRTGAHRIFVGRPMERDHLMNCK
jgi:hypothetical protein